MGGYGKEGRGADLEYVLPSCYHLEKGSGAWNQVEKNMPEYFEQVRKTIPFGRFGKPEEVSRVVTFMASPMASWVTGTNIIVDGGQHKGVD